MTRYFRGADYHIIIRNPEHIKNGKAEVYADGSICDSGLIPDYQDAKQHRIDVLIKRGNEGSKNAGNRMKKGVYNGLF